MTPRETASRIGQRQLREIESLPDLLCLEQFRSEYEKLVAKIGLTRFKELQAATKSAQAEIQQEFAAEAGFLIGLEIGRGLAKGGAR